MKNTNMPGPAFTVEELCNIIFTKGLSPEPALRQDFFRTKLFHNAQPQILEKCGRVSQPGTENVRESCGGFFYCLIKGT